MQHIVTTHSLVGLRVLSHTHVCPGSPLAAGDLPKPDPEILHRSLDLTFGILWQRKQELQPAANRVYRPRNLCAHIFRPNWHGRDDEARRSA